MPRKAKDNSAFIAERNKKICELYKEGKNSVEIGKIVHLTANAVWYILRKNGFSTGRVKKGLGSSYIRKTPIKQGRAVSQKERIVQKWRCGISLLELSRMFDVSISTCFLYIQQAEQEA